MSSFKYVTQSNCSFKNIRIMNFIIQHSTHNFLRSCWNLLRFLKSQRWVQIKKWRLRCLFVAQCVIWLGSLCLQEWDQCPCKPQKVCGSRCLFVMWTCVHTSKMGGNGKTCHLWSSQKALNRYWIWWCHCPGPPSLWEINSAHYRWPSIRFIVTEARREKRIHQPIELNLRSHSRTQLDVVKTAEPSHRDASMTAFKLLTVQNQYFSKEEKKTWEERSKREE